MNFSALKRDGARLRRLFHTRINAVMKKRCSLAIKRTFIFHVF